MKNKKMIFPAVALLTLAGAITIGTGVSAVSEIYAAVTARQAQYRIIYNPCYAGGSLKYAQGTVGTTIELDEPSRSGYGFLGWSTKYSPSTKMGTTADIIQGKEYTITAKNIVLYAVWQKGGSGHTSEEVKRYMEGLKETSVDGHFYIHYYRWLNTAEDYANWDIWSWPYRPDEGEGYNFDFAGGIDDYGGAICDIDLTKTYDGGWDNINKVVGGTPVSFLDEKGDYETQVGIQFVKKSTRKEGSGFWANDGGNIYVTLEDYAIDLAGGGKAFHVFALQDSTQDFTAVPLTAEERIDPFENDDGKNVTKENDTLTPAEKAALRTKYDNADWNDKPIAKTAPDWKKVGAGYQIMVSSFADSDGDGFGDIYGITQKLDYLKGLNVKALWLTPIQKSDSYHGYDISDYEKVDQKFGSKVSPAGLANNGVVTEDTAMADYEELIDKAGKAGMKIVMDLVLNHTSTSNVWFIRSAQLSEEYRGYYQWGNHVADPSHINQDASWYPYGDHDYSYYAKFGSGMPELNYSYKSTREAVEDMSLFWCGKGVSGFRLDAVKHIFMEDECNVAPGDTVINDFDEKKGVSYSSDLTKNLNFYKELNYTVKQAYPNCFFVGENFDGHAYQVGPYYEAFDSMFDFYTYFNLTSMAAMATNPSGGAQGYGGSFMRGASPATDCVGKEFNGHTMTWNAPKVFENYSQWRGDTALPGCFTSNHDIARTINRIAGTGDPTGVQAQGEIKNGSDYAKFNKAAMAVKLAEIFMPGVTWVYYGDEIGMTGNFLMNAKTADDDYSDLAYRQPMKWVSSGVVGDGSMTTGYAINGAKSPIYLDDINASSSVVPAMTQKDQTNSDYAKIAAAIKLKNDNPEVLITGSFADANSQDSQLNFSRSGGGKTFKVEVNFSTCSVKVTQGSSVLFSY